MEMALLVSCVPGMQETRVRVALELVFRYQLPGGATSFEMMDEAAKAVVRSLESWEQADQEERDRWSGSHWDQLRHAAEKELHRVNSVTASDLLVGPKRIALQLGWGHLSGWHFSQVLLATAGIVRASAKASGIDPAVAQQAWAEWIEACVLRVVSEKCASDPEGIKSVLECALGHTLSVS